MKDPFIEDDLRAEYSQNIEEMPEDLKKEYDYIWLVRFGSDEICQFDENGNEQVYTKVREKEEGLNRAYWIPVEEGKKTYGIKGPAQPFRRCAIEFTSKGKKKVFYYVLANANDQAKAKKFLVISPDGEVIQSDNYDFNPHKEFK